MFYLGYCLQPYSDLPLTRSLMFSALPNHAGLSQEDHLTSICALGKNTSHHHCIAEGTGKEKLTLA